MERSFVTLCILLLCQSVLLAQAVSGEITDESGEPLHGATVFCLETNFATVSDAAGIFKINGNTPDTFTLAVQFVGMQSDTTTFRKDRVIRIRMRPDNVLDDVSVTARKQGSFVSAATPIKTEVISQVELSRAACCDLAGCFGTEASVHSATTNIVTNTKELRVLGLSGVYNQLLVNGFPLLQGASYTYGVSSIPGTLVENIYVAKGSNSVLQGFESIAGQINVTLKDPDVEDDLMINAYANSFAEKQVNVNYAYKGDEWSSILSAHTTQPSSRIDGDGDRFLDLPLVSKYSVYNAWKRGNEAEWGPHTLVGFRYVDETRIGGQVDFDSGIHLGGNAVYGQRIKYRQPEAFLKTGFRMDDVHHWVLMASGFYHDQKSHFGTLGYEAGHASTYLNLQYEHSWLENNVLKTGTSLRYNRLEEDIRIPTTETFRTYGQTYLKKELIPGLFAENTFRSRDDQWTLITGLRLDHHNKFGFHLTPRALVRVQATDHTTMRFSAGTGWRTAFVFSEQVQLLASSRNVVFLDELKPEQSFNVGFNVVQNLSAGRMEAYASFDAYHTAFQNQIFPDYFRDPAVVYLYNSEGTSVSNSLKGEVNLALDQVYTLKLAYNFLDVYRREGAGKQDIPFVPNHSALASFSYRPINNVWQLDATLHWTGRQRLADTSDNPEVFQRPDFSSPFSKLNIQVLKRWSSFELYAGCENVFGFRQNRPIISSEDPFGRYFDTASVWGPTRGREVYLGVRLRVNRNAK